MVREKELQPWESDSVGDIDGLEGIEDAGEGIDDRGWDAKEMFITNAEKFNIRSDYDPNLTQYTTPLHKSDTQEFRQREARAHQLALEIEHGAEYAKRVALENGDNEEMMFSAVVRPSTSSTSSSSPVSSGHSSASGSSTGKYIAPHLRNSAVVMPAQRPQQLEPNPSTVPVTAASAVPAQISLNPQQDVITMPTDTHTEGFVNGAETAVDLCVVSHATLVSSSDLRGATDRDVATNQPQPKHTVGSKSTQVVEELKKFNAMFKLSDSCSPDQRPSAGAPAANCAMTSAAATGITEVPSVPTAVHDQTIVQSPPPVHPTALNTTPLYNTPPVHQPPTVQSTTAMLHQTVQPSAGELHNEKHVPPNMENKEPSSDVAKKSSLNPLAKEFNPLTKPVQSRVMPSTTPPRPLSVPQSPVSMYPAPVPGPQILYPPQQVLVPVQQQQQQQQQQQHSGPRYPPAQKRVTVSARGTGEPSQQPQSAGMNGAPLLSQPVMQINQGHLAAYPAQQLVFHPQYPGMGMRLVLPQQIVNMGPSHDPNMPQIVGPSSQPAGLYLTQYAPQHPGAQPPQMSSHGPSSQQTQSHGGGGPVQSAASGHQTPTPAQHTPQFTMQQVGTMAMIPQQQPVMGQQPHLFHTMPLQSMMQHQVVGQPQGGGTPQSPQVSYTSVALPLHYSHQSGGVISFVQAPQPLGPPPQSGAGMPPPPSAHQGQHVMMAQQTPQHPSMHSGMQAAQMIMQGQPQPGMPQQGGGGVGPTHQYAVQSHGMQGASNIPQGHPGMTPQHMPMYAAVPPHAMQQQAQAYQHGTQ
jgi:hypothetical protein